MAYQRKLYEAIASRVYSRIDLLKKDRTSAWIGTHTIAVDYLTENRFPSGSGFNKGTSFNWDMSTGERLVFDLSFHHMDEHGYYDGWTEHQVIVKPSLVFGFTIRVTGRDRNGIKEYIADTFRHILNTITEE